MINEQNLLQLAKTWLDIDVNPVTRSEIQQLVKTENFEELDNRLSARILFGTAGLRSKMEAGFSRMNDVTVLQASQGLAEYIIKKKPGDGQPSFTVGFDHRHNSKRFAELTAAVFLHKGFKVYFLGPDIVATPLVPFTIDHFNTLGGVMVTASHNPKQDNGYKVYWKSGCQIISPHDSNIQNSIMDNLTPIFNDGKWDTQTIFNKFKSNLVYVRDEMIQSYISEVSKKLIKTKVEGFKAVYTAVHGVGTQFAQQVDQELGGDILVYVDEQCKPDPEFSTVSFPNPEEKGALDLAMAKADSLNIPLVVANDPDADRFSAAVKTDGKWRQLTGNEIGFLFADYVISEIPGDELGSVYLLNSTVSSQMIGSMAKKLGFHYQDTLTGFKWIGNRAIDYEHEGFKVPFAYEEAIGFMFSVVHDKDGISALSVFLQMYQKWLKEGKTAIDILESGFKKYGYFKECNGYYVVPDLNTTPRIFNDTMRKYAPDGEKFPQHIGQFEVTSWRDLTTGFDSTTSDNKPLLPVDPSSQMITCGLKTGVEDEFIRFTTRGSGTEPKLKVYIEASAKTETRASELGKQVWNTLKNEWFQPEVNQLVERV